jgi:hypothetical protein
VTVDPAVAAAGWYIGFACGFLGGLVWAGLLQHALRRRP